MHWFRYRLQTKLEKGVETRTWNLPCGVPPASLQTATSPSARPIAISNGETVSSSCFLSTEEKSRGNSRERKKKLLQASEQDTASTG